MTRNNDNTLVVMAKIDPCGGAWSCLTIIARPYAILHPSRILTVGSRAGLWTPPHTPAAPPLARTPNRRYFSVFVPIDFDSRRRRKKNPLEVMSEEEEASNKYVKLVSAEGLEFFLERKIAIAGSGTIRTMLEGQFRESSENKINFPDISGYILDRVVRYLHYKAQHSQSTTRIPEFIIEPEVALELMIAAKYLDC